LSLLQSVPAARVMVVLLCLSGVARAQTVSVPLSREHLIFSEKNFKIPEQHPPERNGATLEFLGRRAFHHARGLTYIRDLDFADGTIDVDFAATEETRFLGLAFHIQSEDSYEVIFVRPGGSLTSQAIQYTPAFLGAPCWQIYTGPGYTAAAEIPRKRWMHARIVVANNEARLFLNGSREPALVVADLKLGPAHGSIGFWGHLGDGYFSNLTYTPASRRDRAPAKSRFLAGALTDWEISPLFDAGDVDPSVYPDARAMSWEKVNAESPGMVVINRYRRSPNIDTPERQDRLRGRVRGSKVVFARTAIRSDQEIVRKLKLAYSDDVVLFLNGRPLYAGNNELGFRQPNFLGLLDPESDLVFLPLKRGENELMLAVSEFFGGWGYLCQLE
jgi:hypothetical protein